MTDNDKPDYFPGIFDDISPSDFMMTTSAIGEHWTAGSDHNAGQVAFDRFIKENIETLRMSYTYVWGAAIDPIAVLATLDTQWVFGPDADEDLSSYIKRLARESDALQGRWIFISRRTAVAPDTDVDDVMSQPVDRNGMIEAFYWYAMRVEDGAIQRRHGYLTIDEDERRTLGESIEMDPEQTNALFDQILLR